MPDQCKEVLFHGGPSCVLDSRDRDKHQMDKGFAWNPAVCASELRSCSKLSLKLVVESLVSTGYAGLQPRTKTSNFGLRS